MRKFPKLSTMHIRTPTRPMTLHSQVLLMKFQLKINFTNSFLRGGNDYKHISIVLCTNTNSIYVLISTNILYLRTSNLQNDTSGIRLVCCCV